MTDHDTDGADIAWMRRLAEEGADAPMRGASILMAAGLVFGVASLIHGSVVKGWIDLPPTAFNFLWLAATAVFLAIVALVTLRLRSGGGVVTAANRASRAAWSAVGYGIFALMVSLAVVASRLGGEAGLAVISIIPSAILAFYGLGWSVMSAMTRSRFLGSLAAASLVAAPLMALLTGAAEQYFAYGAALFVLMAAPGWLLMRRSGRA